jgi:PAS domain S-box-containing protein
MDRHTVFAAPKQHTRVSTRPQNAPAREYAALVSMADAVYCVDPARRVTFVNPAFEAMTGHALADLRGTPSTHLYVPEAEALPLERRRQVYSGTPVPPSVETVLLLKDGRRLPVEVAVSSLIIEGQISGRVGVLRDITSRKQAEAALREREEHIRRLNTHLQADLARMTRLQQVSTRLVQTHDVAALLDEILDAALAITDADMGNIQLLDGDTLKIVAHRGFEAPFLDFFNTVHEGLAACGTAL